MIANSIKTRLEFSAAVMLGFFPLGQTVYFLLVDQLGLPLRPGVFGVFAAILLLVPMLALITHRTSAVRLNQIDIVVLLLFALMIGNLAFRTIGPTLRDTILLALLVIGPYLAGRLVTPSLMRPFLYGLLAACLATAIYTFGFVASLLDSLETVIRPKILGIDHGVHLVGIAGAFLICFITASIDTPKQTWKRIALYILASMSIASLLVLSSRGMTLIVATTVVMSIFFFPRRGLRHRAILLLCLALSAYATLSVSPATMAFLSRAIPGDLDGVALLDCAALLNSNNSADIRMAFYRTAIDLFLAHPLFGVGLFNFAENFCPTTFPHSTLLQIAAETGLMGLILTGLLLYRLSVQSFTAIRHLDDSAPKDSLVLLALLICSLGIDQLYGSLSSMASSMTLLGATVSWLSAKDPMAQGTAAPARAQR